MKAQPQQQYPYPTPSERRLLRWLPRLTGDPDERAHRVPAEYRHPLREDGKKWR